MLSLLESLMPEPASDVARKIADDFRKRRIEKGLTREDIAMKSVDSLFLFLLVISRITV